MKKKHKKYLCTHRSDDGMHDTLDWINGNLYCTKCKRKISVLDVDKEGERKFYEAIDVVLAGIETMKILSTGSDEDYNRYYKMIPKIKKLKKDYNKSIFNLQKREAINPSRRYYTSTPGSLTALEGLNNTFGGGFVYPINKEKS